MRHCNNYFGVLFVLRVTESGASYISSPQDRPRAKYHRLHLKRHLVIVRMLNVFAALPRVTGIGFPHTTTPMSVTSSPSLPVAADSPALETIIQSMLLILVSEIGDKTFLIAALLAMRHPRLVVFSGAFASLLFMSALSASLGYILPTLMPRSWTQLAAAMLFLMFGVKMADEARKMKGSAGSERMREEMREVEEEIAEDDGDDVPMKVLEEGKRESHSPSRSSFKSTNKSRWIQGARNFSNLVLGPVFVQAFVLTFLGEWGDRSQIATIALGASHVSIIILVYSLSPPSNPHVLRMYISLLWVQLLDIVSAPHWRLLEAAMSPPKYLLDTVCQIFIYADPCAYTPPLVTGGGAILFLLFSVIYFYEACAEWGNVEVPLTLNDTRF
jgi:putative Ca2+/H+ antiporter (TMEM165/GDT1 family)